MIEAINNALPAWLLAMISGGIVGFMLGRLSNQYEIKRKEVVSE